MHSSPKALRTRNLDVLGAAFPDWVFPEYIYPAQMVDRKQLSATLSLPFAEINSALKGLGDDPRVDPPQNVDRSQRGLR